MIGSWREGWISTDKIWALDCYDIQDDEVDEIVKEAMSSDVHEIYLNDNKIGMSPVDGSGILVFI
jgi:hypothetical protein